MRVVRQYGHTLLPILGFLLGVDLWIITTSTTLAGSLKALLIGLVLLCLGYIWVLYLRTGEVTTRLKMGTSAAVLLCVLGGWFGLSLTTPSPTKTQDVTERARFTKRAQPNTTLTPKDSVSAPPEPNPPATPAPAAVRIARKPKPTTPRLKPRANDVKPMPTPSFILDAGQ